MYSSELSRNEDHYLKMFEETYQQENGGMGISLQAVHPNHPKNNIFYILKNPQHLLIIILIVISCYEIICLPCLLRKNAKN